MAASAPSARPAALASQLDELDSHMDALLAEDDPSQHFEADLFDRISYQLGPVSYPDITERFLPRLAAVLKKTAAIAQSAQAAQAAEAASTTFKGYPPPLLTLTIKLLRPLSFTSALELCPAPYLITALASDQEYINALALAILTKATAAPSDASILASTPLLLEALLERWLISPSVSVGQQGVLLLGDLLDIDCPLSQPPFTDAQRDAFDIRLLPRRTQGHGAVWRRLFARDGASLVWALLQRLDTTLLPAASADSAVRHQRSLAQDRLLRLLPRLAVLDFPSLATCMAPFGPAPHDVVSLLEFATLRMVDRTTDELLRLTWTDYVMKLVGAMRIADSARLSVVELRRLVREARDPALIEALWRMPDNSTVWTPAGDEEATRDWLRDVVPRPAPRIANGLSSEHERS